MPDRFYSAPLGQSDRAILTGNEAHHLAQVRRIKVGQRVHLFDGSGLEAEAVVESIAKRQVELAVIRCEPVNRELPFSLTLACVPPKGERFRWLIEKATELGVSRFVPLVTEHAAEHVRGTSPDKMQRWVIESSKQCGRNVLMEIDEPRDWSVLATSPPSGTRIVAHPTGQPFARPSAPWLADGLVLAIGPEGGFTQRELGHAAAHNWTLVSLGPRILRVETAAIGLAAWCVLGQS